MQPTPSQAPWTPPHSSASCCLASQSSEVAHNAVQPHQALQPYLKLSSPTEPQGSHQTLPNSTEPHSHIQRSPVVTSTLNTTQPRKAPTVTPISVQSHRAKQPHLTQPTSTVPSSHTNITQPRRSHLTQPTPTHTRTHTHPHTPPHTIKTLAHMDT